MNDNNDNLDLSALLKKPTLKESVMSSITDRRISLLDLGLITGFLALLSTITAILIGVFT